MSSLPLSGKKFSFRPIENAAWFPLPDSVEATTVSLLALTFFPLIFSYILSWALYHWNRRYGKPGQLPPRYPSFIPWIGGAVTILFDGQSFLDRAT